MPQNFKLKQLIDSTLEQNIQKSINIQTHTQNLEHDLISRLSEGSKTVYVLVDKTSWFQSILRVLLRVWEQ